MSPLTSNRAYLVGDRIRSSTYPVYLSTYPNRLDRLFYAPLRQKLNLSTYPGLRAGIYICFIPWPCCAASSVVFSLEVGQVDRLGFTRNYAVRTYPARLGRLDKLDKFALAIPDNVSQPSVTRMNPRKGGVTIA